MFFLLQRALMFHSSSTYHYLEQTWLYVFAVALERFNHLYGYREKSWTTLFPAGCPSLYCEFDSMPARHSLSTIPIELVNVVARKVYTREELFVIRAQNYRWSNNSLYYRLKSLGIFKYRGRRSGFSSKLCLQTNNQAIPAICSRRCRDDLCASYNFRQTFGSARLARKPSYNLITIESQATVPKISTVKPVASSQCVPSLFLSNVMSLAPKIDEVNSVVINANVDVVCITETWLQSHIPDSVVAINGYNLIRRDRRDARRGGVCMYIKSSIPFTVLEDPEDEKCSFEVLWIKMRPTRLPRGISSIIAGVVYHPPKATNSMMLDYLTKCLMDVESKYSNYGFLVLGDLNHLNDARLKSNFKLKQIVHFSTRGQNTLDKILTTITTTPRLNVPLLVFQIIAQLKYSQSKGLKHRKQYKLLFQGTYDQVIVLQCKRIYMKSMLLR